ncbi:TetR/AcrR family transcriptional regulator [Streptomyces sp. ID05-47C]|uniref:TetR/AcrR family transcriptional regulator n=1 Tax=Streptomyces sp. ID05-47C TaxID=3028665 RepID=UPI0029A74062|nr:TetR/AcrR family transcriptional regulator [Streptomyces sp. ID05-47C]MDX3569211.1 TetR/AcrR family transcriptional regulator [Streptomyces sp. ID05-47C]
MATVETTTTQPRERILGAATALLAEGGRDAVSTRAVSAAAGVQAQTIYRHFGDMQGLLDEVARRGYASYLAAKQAQGEDDDPVTRLRNGWDMHVAFGLANPALYRLLYTEPRPGQQFAVTGAAQQVLLGIVERVARAGRLRTGVEPAAAMIHSAGMGVTLTLIAAQADGRLSHYEGLSESVREAVLDSVLAPAPADDDDVVARPGTGSHSAAVHAVALKSLMRDGVRSLTSGERTLLGEWLDRVAAEDSAAADTGTAGSAGSEAGTAEPGAGSARRP